MTDKTSIHQHITRASVLLILSMLVSRIIGFFRDMAIAHTMGASPVTDVYYASFTIPDFINHLMAAGALSVSFIPILSQFVSANDEITGKRIFQTLSTYMGLLLIVLILIAEVFAENLVSIIAPGFNIEQRELLTRLIRIVLPAQFFFYWGGLATAVQQTYGRFFIPAMAPVIYNLFTVTLGLLMFRAHGVIGFSVGIVVGAVIGHGLLQWWGIRALGYSVVPCFSLASGTIRWALRRYCYLTIPIMFSFSLVVADEWISKYFASFLEPGSISWLSYARTEMRIPIAIIGQAAGMASFPYLSRLWAEKNYALYSKTLTREVSKLVALAPIGAVIMVIHAVPITHFLYGGNRFTPNDLHATAHALRIYCLGVVFWTLQILFSRAFYSCQKTWFPSLMGTVVSFVAIPFYWWAGKNFGYSGIALCGSLGITVYVIVLTITFASHLKGTFPPFSAKPLVVFAATWLIVIAASSLIAHGISTLGIYQETRLTGLLEVVVSTITIGLFALVLLRTVFQKLTDGPLY